MISVLVYVFFISSVIAAVPVSFAVVSGNEAVAIREVWVNLLAEISDVSGHNLKLQLNHDHGSIVEGFRSGDLVMAVVDPLQMEQMVHESTVVPLLEVMNSDGVVVRSRFYVRKDSVIRNLEDLRDRTLAILPPGIHYAASELPMEMISSIPEMHVAEVWVDTSASIVKAIRYGAVDAGVIAEIIPDQVVDTAELRLIAESDPVALWYVVARPNYSAEVIAAIRNALLSCNGVFAFKLPEHNAAL